MKNSGQCFVVMKVICFKMNSVKNAEGADARDEECCLLTLLLSGVENLFKIEIDQGSMTKENDDIAPGLRKGPCHGTKWL